MRIDVNVQIIVVGLALAVGCSSDTDAPRVPFADDDGEDETGALETGEGGEDPDEPPAGDGDGEPASPPMPDNAYCQGVSDWDQDWEAYAEQVIEQVNAARALGRDCGSKGSFGPAPPLQWHANLTCAARVHSRDMAEHDFFDHSSSDGHDPIWRYEQAGFTGAIWAENLGAGYPSASDAVEGWLGSDIHCANTLNPSYVAIGVGYAFAPDSTHDYYWTLSFGGP